MVVAAAARHGIGVVLQRGVAARHVAHGAHGLVGKRAAPEVRVHDDARGVDHAAQRRARPGERPGARRFGERRNVDPFACSCKHGSTRLVDGLAHAIGQHAAGDERQKRAHLGQLEHLLHLRERAEQIGA